MTKPGLPRVTRLLSLFAEMDIATAQIRRATTLREVGRAMWRATKAIVRVEMIIHEIKRDTERLKRENELRELARDRIPKARTVTR